MIGRAQLPLKGLLVAAVVVAVTIMFAVNPVFGLLTATALASALTLAVGLWGRNRDDGLDVELVDRGEEVILVARARYGLGLDIHTTDYGFLIRNARGDKRVVRLGFRPRIVSKRFQNGVMVLVCRPYT